MTIPQRRGRPSAAAEGRSQDPARWREHLSEIVLPAWQDYLSAEHRLSLAMKLGDEAAALRQGYAALRSGAAAALFLHHFADVVLKERPHFLPPGIESAADAHEWLTGYCTYLRTDRIAADVLLLADVVEGLKHAHLTQVRPFNGADDVALLSIASGSEELPPGEGKVDALEQVVIQVKSGPRALSAVLQNVVDAWRRAAGIRLPEIGLP